MSDDRRIENHMVLPYADDDAVPGIDSLDDYDDSYDVERAYERGEIGRDRNGEDDDAFELRRTIKDIAGVELPYLMRQQAD